MAIIKLRVDRNFRSNFLIVDRISKNGGTTI